MVCGFSYKGLVHLVSPDDCDCDGTFWSRRHKVPFPWLGGPQDPGHPQPLPTRQRAPHRPFIAPPEEASKTSLPPLGF